MRGHLISTRYAFSIGPAPEVRGARVSSHVDVAAIVRDRIASGAPKALSSQHTTACDEPRASTGYTRKHGRPTWSIPAQTPVGRAQLSNSALAIGMASSMSHRARQFMAGRPFGSDADAARLLEVCKMLAASRRFLSCMTKRILLCSISICCTTRRRRRRQPTTTTTNERGTTAATRMTSMEKSRCSQQKPNILCASRDACLW